VSTRTRCRRQLGRSEQIAVQAGVDEVVRDAGRAQQSLRDLRRPELGTSCQIIVRRRVLLETEQRRAPPAHRKPEWRVEPRRTAGQEMIRLGEVVLERRSIESPADHAVAVLVYER